MACRFDAWKNGAGLGKNNCLSLALYLCMIYLTTLRNGKENFVGTSSFTATEIFSMCVCVCVCVFACICMCIKHATST